MMNIIDVNSWNKILDRMIIIGGSARSGTTIMGKLLSSLKSVEYLIEPPMLSSLLLRSGTLDDSTLKELLQFYFIDDFLLDSLAGRRINLNENDDSYILHVKTQKEIQKRQEKSYKRIELEEISKEATFCFKDHRVSFFLDVINRLFPDNNLILMHRNPNDIINSLMMKKWFSNQYLSADFPHQVHAVKIIKGIKIPFWVEPKYEDFWLKAEEVDRCAYYCKRIFEEMFYHADNAIIVSYDQFILRPEDFLFDLMRRLNLTIGEKTNSILETINYRNKERVNYLDKVSEPISKDLQRLDSILYECSIQPSKPSYLKTC